MVMSFLEKEDAKPSTFWDWVVGIGLIVVIAGFTFYYQWEKRLSLKRFNEADALFAEGKFREASAAYEELKDAQYLTSKNDSLIYARLDSVEELEEQEQERVARLRSKLAAGDTAGARAEYRSAPFHGLLGEKDQEWLDGVKKEF
jgi:hypothetical protein